MIVVPDELRATNLLKRDAPYDLDTTPNPKQLAKLLKHIRKTREVLRKAIEKEGKSHLSDYLDAIDATLELEAKCIQSLLVAVELGDSEAVSRHTHDLREASALALPLNYLDFTLKGISKGRRARA